MSFRFIYSRHVINCCVKTIPKTASCMLLRDCSLLSNEVQDYSCDLELSAYGATTVEANSSCAHAWIYRKSTLVPVLIDVIDKWGSCAKFFQVRSKIWPEPDLDWCVKKGQMPDLPELEPKSSTSLVKSKILWNYGLEVLEISRYSKLMVTLICPMQVVELWLTDSIS